MKVKTWLSCILPMWLMALVATSYAQDNLSQSEAEQRFQQVKQVDYQIEFWLKPKQELVDGRTLMKVKLQRLDAPLRIDTTAKTITSITINQQPLSNYTRDEGYLLIPATALSAEMDIELRYQFAFGTEGVGLTRVEDPEDKREYLYTDLEPFGAHQVFPCFDQPDLKASFEVTAHVPKHWEVIGNNPIVSQTPEQRTTAPELKTVRLSPTKRISTYLFFFGAGEYKVWRDQAGKVPLAIYARQSLSSHVDAKAIFKLTKQGLAYYNQYFDYTYPFPKYDHIFCPDYNPGAMENPGAVTMNERMIYRGPVPLSTYADRAETILHEMAHMWFGDLVTMKWWNDLWLNESFATFMSNKALAKLWPEYNAWQPFLGTKRWALWQDKLSTSHPIETAVPNVMEATSNFDGITYGKGAASLKQLEHFVGERAFQKGMQQYFKTHAWGNTLRSDFTSAIAKASKQDLEVWAKAWLQSFGPNTMQVEFSCEDKQLSKLSLTQSKNKEGLLAPHKTTLALYAYNGKSVRTYAQFPVAIAGERELIKVKPGLACPDFVAPNFQDKDYGLYYLDAKSTQFALEHPTAFTVAMERQMLWEYLGQMVLDGKVKLNDFFTFALKALKTEKDTALLGQMIGRYAPIRNLIGMYPWSKDKGGEWYPALVQLVQEHVAQGFKTDDANKYLWLDFSITLATAQAEGQRYLNSLLAPKPELLAGTDLDQVRRWQVLRAMSFLGDKSVQELMKQELKRDPSYQGEKEAYAIEVAFPALGQKKAMWKQLTDLENGLNFSKRSEGTEAFHHFSQPKLAEHFTSSFFDFVENMPSSGGGLFFIENIFQNLFPHPVCSEGLLTESERRLANMVERKGEPRLVRAWKEANDQLKQCLSLRK